MEITDVRVFPVHEARLRGFATITLDDCFVVRDLRIIAGESGLFVAMPSRRLRDGSHRDVAHPINQRSRDRLESVVLSAYERECALRPGSMRPGSVGPVELPLSPLGDGGAGEWSVAAPF